MLKYSLSAAMLRGTLAILAFLAVAQSGLAFDLNTISAKLQKMAETGVPDQEVAKYLRLRQPYKFIDNFVDLPIFDGQSDSAKLELTCEVCEVGVSSFIGWFEAGDTSEEIVDKGVNLCLSLNIQTERVCRGFLAANVNIFYHIFNTRTAAGIPLTKEEICGFLVFPLCWIDNPLYEWTLDFDFLGPKPTPETPELPPTNSPVMKVLQLTDIHIDPNYQVGANAACDEPTCCRADQGAPENATGAAGYWGDYRDCDLPIHAFQNLVDQASTHDDIAYVIFTGDIIDHGVWATSQQGNTDLFILAMTEMRSKFNVPVLPIFGNHETHPMNVFTTPEMNVPTDLTANWLYELAAYFWEGWVPGQSENILKGGFYSYEVNPNLKVIALNTMFCYNYNFWLMLSNYDPAGELMWLAQELLAAEQANQKVHILSHIPGNSDCYKVWGKHYSALIDRFENTVVGQFYGHTHNDHYFLFFDPSDPERATNVGFIGGSGTAYSDVNPNYRIYNIDGEYDGSSYRVLDHETWYFNLTEANLAGESVLPNWQKLYTFTEAYGVDSVFPQEMYNVLLRMIDDPQLLQQYYGYYMKLGDPAMAEGCDESCARKQLCKILTSVESDLSKCDQLLPPLP